MSSNRVACLGVLLAFLVVPPAVAACSSDDPSRAAGDGGASSGSSGSGTFDASAGSSGGTSGGTSGSGSSSSGGSSGSSGTGSDGGGSRDGSTKPDTGPLPPDPCVDAGTCPPGTWHDVTPAGSNDSDFGAGAPVVDPARPSDIYIGGYDDGLWKSTDYGNTWKQLATTIDGQAAKTPSIPQGLVLAVAGTAPDATLWLTKPCACGQLLKSTDGGHTFKTTGKGVPAGTDFYSFVVDPSDDNHLLSGLHEADGVVESTDGGETWKVVGTTGSGGFPSGGVSWFPYFLDTGDAKTRTTWFAIAQNGGSPVVTHDGGATWAIPAGLNGITHPHGSSQIFQRGADVFVAGQGGIFRSTDRGATFSKLRDGNYGTVWGSDKSLYAAWGWACGRSCQAGPDMVTSAMPGDAWTPLSTSIPTGTQRIAITSDGTHTIYVAAMWWAGVWRYVEAN